MSQLSQSAGHPILLCLKPEPQLLSLWHEGVALAVSLRRPLHALALVPKARGQGAAQAVQHELETLAAQARQAVPQLDVLITVELLSGLVERRIISIIQERNARLVVIGRRPRTAKLQAQHHGTTEALLALIDVPLLILPS
jgi:nucleotide-binding universal stress UspA family protein